MGVKTARKAVKVKHPANRTGNFSSISLVCRRRPQIALAIKALM